MSNAHLMTVTPGMALSVDAGDNVWIKQTVEGGAVELMGVCRAIVLAVAPAPPSGRTRRAVMSDEVGGPVLPASDEVVMVLWSSRHGHTVARHWSWVFLA